LPASSAALASWLDVPLSVPPLLVDEVEPLDVPVPLSCELSLEASLPPPLSWPLPLDE
jgi:hypothetical protein